MKKTITSLCVLFILFLSACEGDNRNNNDANTFKLTEINNPPILEHDEQLFIVLNNKMIVTQNSSNGEFSLLRYEEGKWEPFALRAGLIYLSIVNDKTVLIHNILYYDLLTYHNGQWNPTPLPADASYVYPLNENTIITYSYDAPTNKYHLFTYNGGSTWNENQLAYCSYVQTINNKTFVAHFYEQGSHYSTLYIYDEYNKKWKEHNEIKKKDDIYILFDNTILVSSSGIEELWELKDGKWKLVIDELVLHISYDLKNFIFQDSKGKYSLWQYRNAQWSQIIGFEVNFMEFAIEDFLLVDGVLWNCNKGTWQPYSPMSGKDLSFVNGALWDSTDEYWLYKNGDWQPSVAFKIMINSNPFIHFITYINDNTALVENKNTGKNELYNDSLTIPYNTINTYAYNDYRLINENTIVLYSSNLNEYILLTYDGSTWRETTLGSQNVSLIKENSFYNNNDRMLWVYENGSWNPMLIGYRMDYQYSDIDPVSLIAYNLNAPYGYILYQYSDNKWNKIFDADFIVNIINNWFTIATGIIDGVNSNVDIWSFDGKEWKMSQSFDNASYGNNYIRTADGKLYCFNP